MLVRKRGWTTSKGVEKEAWIVDYVDQTGKRRLKTFAKKKAADSFAATANVEIRAGVHTADSLVTVGLTVGRDARYFINARQDNGLDHIGSGQVYRIRDVVDILTEIAGMSGRIEWDHSKPNGQAYRAYDLSKIKGLGINPAYSLRAGVEETWKWYCARND